jgi:TfoX/Sxy family transcriptional regulator of competence genes
MQKGSWRKAPPELVDKFNSVIPGPPAQTRQMFGYPAAFVGGNMFMGLHEDRFILRLPEQEREKLLNVAGAEVFEPMAGRPMKEYIVVPQSVLSSSAKLKSWIEKSLDYAKSLPAKKPKAKTRAKSGR